MKSLKTTCFWAIAVIIAGLAPLNALAQDVQHGRISYTAESGLIKGVDDDEWAFAGLNSIVMPGDTIWADDEGVLEVELSGGTFLRLADGSRVDIVSMPPAAVLRGWTGSFYIQRVSNTVGDFVFETPVARIHVEPDSQVRIDVLDKGPVTVSVRWGRAVIHTDVGEAVRLKAGERSYIDPGYLPSTPVSFDRSVEDAFDTWNRDRARQIAYGSSNVPIASATTASAPIGMSDLNAYGEWVYIDNKPYWRPTIEDYLPYRNGYWSYVPAQGYVWVGQYPFAYITSHHGYWSHHSNYGWLWQYHHAYSPAYVFSVRYGDQFIWAPIDPYGYPVYYASDYFTIGGIHFSLGFSSFSYSHELLYGHHYSHALLYTHISHHHNDYHYWNIHARDSRYDTHVRPHWPRDRVRNYAPSRVLRGPTENREGTRRARDRVARLESRTGRDRFAIDGARNNRGVRTAIASGDRRSTVRQVRIRPEALERTARRNQTDRLRNATTNRDLRTITNRDARGGSRERIQRGSGAVRTGSPTRIREQAGSRATSSRPTVTRPRSVTRTRPQASRPSASRSAPSNVRTDRRSGVGAPPTQRGVRQPVASRPTPRVTVIGSGRTGAGNRPSVNSVTTRRSPAPSAVSRRNTSPQRSQSTYRAPARNSAPRSSSVSRPSASPQRSQSTYRAPARTNSPRTSPSVSSRSSSAPRAQSAPRSSSGRSTASQSRGGGSGRSSSGGGRTGRSR